jgi:hypothetical protein
MGMADLSCDNGVARLPSECFQFVDNPWGEA